MRRKLALTLAATGLMLLGLPMTARALPVATAPRPGDVASAPITTLQGYRARVSRARLTAERLVEDVDTHIGAHEMAAALNTLLPAVESVQAEGGTVVVDNSTLRSMVSSLDSSKSQGERRAIAARILQHVRSLDRSVGEPARTVPRDRAALRALLATRRQSARNSLSEAVSRLTDRLIDWITKRWSGSPGRKPTAWLFRVVFYGLLFALAALLLKTAYGVVRRLRAAVERHDEQYLYGTRVRPVVAAAESLPPDALGHADELAREGRFREAVRALFGGAARTLVETGLIPDTRTRTNAELLSEIVPLAPSAHPPLRSLTGSFELAWYGHRDPRAEGYSEARDEYVVAVREVVSAASGTGTAGQKAVASP